jgi:hypothetical protein
MYIVFIVFFNHVQIMMNLNTPQPKSSNNLIKVSSIPNGIEPIVVKDKKELDEFVDKLNKLKLESSQKTSLSKNSNGTYSIMHMNNYDRNISQTARFKMKSESGWAIKSFTGYDIRVNCSCDYIGCPTVYLTSDVTNYAIGRYYWTQNHASASWQDSDLSYSIEGTVSCYIVIYGSGEYFLWKDEKYFSGYLYIS